MTRMADALNALNGLGTLFNGVQGMALAAQIAELSEIPLSTAGAKQAFIDAFASAGGNGSWLKPWANLDEAAAGLGALAADDTDGDPVVLHIGKGTYVANTKPFQRPVSLVLGQGARFATASTTLAVVLPSRTAATVLVTSWSITRASDAAGTAGLSTDPAETGVPVFSFTVNTASLYLGGTVSYRGAGPLLSFDSAILRAAATCPSGWALALDNVNASNGVTATGATVISLNSALGGIGAVAADVLGATGGSISGAVTIGTSAGVKRAQTSLVTAWTGAITTDTEGWRGLQNASVTPTGAVVFFPGTVVSGVVATSGSPQTVTFPGTFAAAPQVVISTSAGDATTFAVVTSTTTTTCVITYGGTAPVSFRYVAQA